MTITDKASATLANMAANAEFDDALKKYEAATSALGSPDPLEDAKKSELRRLLADWGDTLRFLNRKIGFTQGVIGYYQARHDGQPHEVPDGAPFGMTIQPFAGDLPPVLPTTPVIGDDIGFPPGVQFAASRRKADGSVEVDQTPDGVGVPHVYKGATINLRKVIAGNFMGNVLGGRQWWIRTP